MQRFEFNYGGCPVQVEDNGRGWEISVEGHLMCYLRSLKEGEFKQAILDRIRAYTLVQA